MNKEEALEILEEHALKFLPKEIEYMRGGKPYDTNGVERENIVEFATSEAAREYWKQEFEEQVKQKCIDFEIWRYGEVYDRFDSSFDEDKKAEGYTYKVAKTGEFVRTPDELYDLFINLKTSIV